MTRPWSSFALHPALAEIFPGRFTKTSPAAVELHALMSVFTDQATSVTSRLVSWKALQYADLEALPSRVCPAQQQEATT